MKLPGNTLIPCRIQIAPKSSKIAPTMFKVAFIAPTILARVSLARGVGAALEFVIDSPHMKVIAATLLLAAGAFAQKIDMQFDQAVDFSTFKTFAIRQGRLNSKNPALNSDLVRKRIDADIEKYLSAKGLEFAGTGRSGLNVRYTLGALRRAELETYPARWWGTRVVRVPYTEGTLVIDLRDPKTQSLVWRAIAQEEKSDASQVEAKLDDMVKKSFEKYPPKPK